MRRRVRGHFAGGRRVKLGVFGMRGMTTGRVRDVNRRAVLAVRQQAITSLLGSQTFSLKDAGGGYIFITLVTLNRRNSKGPR